MVNLCTREGGNLKQGQGVPESPLEEPEDDDDEEEEEEPQPQQV